MLLRASGEHLSKEYDLRAVSKEGFASGVENGELLIEFVNALMCPEETRMAMARKAIVESMGGDALVECAAIAGNFSQLVRIIDHWCHVDTCTLLDGPSGQTRMAPMQMCTWRAPSKARGKGKR